MFQSLLAWIRAIDPIRGIVVAGVTLICATFVYDIGRYVGSSNAKLLQAEPVPVSRQVAELTEKLNAEKIHSAQLSGELSGALEAVRALQQANNALVIEMADLRESNKSLFDILSQRK